MCAWILSSKTRFWKLAIVALNLAAVLLTIALYVVPQVRRAHELIVANNLSAVLLALHNYHDVEKHLPQPVATNARGCPLYSWRASVATYMGARLDGLAADAEWDDPANHYLAKISVTSYCVTEDALRHQHTNIVAVTGPGTAFDSQREASFADVPSDIILLVEMPNTGLHWMQPGDLSIRNVPRDITSGLYGRGVHVAFADDAVWFLGRDVPVEDLAKFFTIKGARQHNREIVLKPYVIDKCSHF